MTDVAERIRVQRERAGLSTYELARRCQKEGHDKASASMITAIENGRRRVDADILVVLARVLETSPNALLGWEGEDDQDVMQLAVALQRMLKRRGRE